MLKALHDAIHEDICDKGVSIALRIQDTKQFHPRAMMLQQKNNINSLACTVHVLWKLLYSTHQRSEPLSNDSFNDFSMPESQNLLVNTEVLKFNQEHPSLMQVII